MSLDFDLSKKSVCCPVCNTFAHEARASGQACLPGVQAEACVALRIQNSYLALQVVAKEGRSGWPRQDISCQGAQDEAPRSVVFCRAPTAQGAAEPRGAERLPPLPALPPLPPLAHKMRGIGEWCRRSWRCTHKWRGVEFARWGRSEQASKECPALGACTDRVPHQQPGGQWPGREE